MSRGPAIVPIRRRPVPTRWRTAAAAPPTESTSTYGTVERPSGRPPDTTGTAISGSCFPAPSSSWLTPCTIRWKNWSSEKTRLVVSGKTSAIESVRWVTRLRAAWFGTYPSSRTASSTAARTCGRTALEPFTTRETVARDTPASSATFSNVGRGRPVLICGSLRVAEAAGADHLAVPVGAVLPGPPLRPVVDVHDAETLGIAISPFEVVQQRPDEVAANVHALAQRLVRRRQMRAQVRDPLRVVHGAVGGVLVGIGGTVLGDQQRYVAVVTPQPQQQVTKPGRVNRPAHVGDRARRLVEPHRVARRPRRRPLVAGRLAPADEHRLVVVEPKHVDRRGDGRQVTVADETPVGERGRVFQDVRRVPAVEHRVEEDAVQQAVDAPHRILVCRCRPDAAHRGEVEHQRHLAVAVDHVAQHLRPETVRPQQVG